MKPSNVRSDSVNKL